MLNKLKEIIKKILNLSKKLDSYEKDSVVQALPSLAYVNRAKKCIEKNNYAEAEKILEEAMELPQEDALVYKYLGLICERTGRLADAIVAYKKSANVNNADKDIWRLLGFALVNCNQSEEAIEAFENANKMAPANTDVFAGWGMALMKLKRYAEAHEKFTEAVRLNRYNFMALLMSAIMEVRLERYNDAEAKLNFLANVSPNETNNYEYANLKYIKQDYDSAIHYAKKSLEFNSNLLPAYLLLGKLYVIKDDKEQSLNMYKTAEERELKSPHLYYDWAITLQMFEEYNDSREKFTKVLEFVPEEQDAKTGLAMIEAIEGNTETAEQILSGINKLDETNYLLTKTKAIIALNKKDYDNAITLLKSIQERMFFDNTIKYFMALAYDGLNNTTKAKEFFEAATEHQNYSINIYIKFAEFLIKIGEPENARRKLHKILKHNENNIDILKLLFDTGYILAKKGDSEYNIKETIAIADKICAITGDAFDSGTKREELENMINREQN